MPQTIMRALVMLAFLPLVRAQESVEISPRQAFASVRIGFQTDLNTLHQHKRNADKSFNPRDVNTVLDSVKSGIFERTPAGDIPLRRYVEEGLPSNVDESAGAIPEEQAETIFRRVGELLDRLTGPPDFRLNLTVNSRPADARVELVFQTDTPMSTRTNGKITNIYRGKYTYHITKNGYKDIQEPIDFIDRSGSVLDCELEPLSSPQDALPCKFH